MPTYLVGYEQCFNKLRVIEFLGRGEKVKLSITYNLSNFLQVISY